MAMTQQTEIERKYDVDENAAIPDLSSIGRVDAAGEVELEAEYFDTERGDLAASRITLRRRRGGHDEGWHVKLPAAEGHTELHWPLTEGDAPPPQLVDRVRSRIRTRELVPIARLSTRRRILNLLGDRGELLAEIADDVVSATDLATGILRLWREWEVELLGGAPGTERERTALLDAIGERLAAAGAVPSASRSKLASALGRTELGRSHGWLEHEASGLDRSSPAASVLMVAIAALVEDLARIDPLVRADEPDSVHQLRTRIRRLRSLFASYRDVFDRAATDPLRARLQEVGLILGAARDAEVMRDRARDLLEDYEPRSNEVDRQLPDGWAASYRVAHQRAIDELSSERWLGLLDDLDAFVARPALAARAREPASDVIPAALGTDLRRVVKRAKTARAAENDNDRFALLHEVRKAAKRLRYSAEAVSEGDAAVFGKRTLKLAAAAEAIHDLLGEHRDSVLMQRYLSETAGSGDHAFDYGVLHEIERHGAALCLADYPRALDDLRSLR